MPARAVLLPRRRRCFLAALLLLAPLCAGAQSPLLELNRADRAELESLPGVGPQLAGRLLAERARSPFADWSDLLRRVRGLGPRLARRLSEAGLRVDGRAYEAAAAPPGMSASTQSS